MSNQNDKEIEIQVRVEYIKPLIKFLNEKASFISQVHQIDKYYIPNHRNFLKTKPIEEWLRLRDSSGKLSINYKKVHYDKIGKTLYRDEYESSIGEIPALEKIFKAIDIKEIVVVDKTRKIYSYNDYEISLDNIKGLGDFIEVEYKGNDKDALPDNINRDMVNFLKEMGCGKITINYMGYPYQILFPKETRVEEV